MLKHLLAGITAYSLLVYDATSLAHLYLGSFSHSSLQILSSSARLDGECHCTAISRSLQRWLIRFKSWLWLGHSRTCRDLSRSHSCVFMAVCLQSLSCWKVNLLPVWGWFILAFIYFITYPVGQKFTYTQLVFGSIAFNCLTWVKCFGKPSTITWVNFGPFLDWGQGFVMATPIPWLCCP